MSQLVRGLNNLLNIKTSLFYSQMNRHQSCTVQYAEER